MLQLLWNMFKETGQINTYMLLKALDDSHHEDSIINAPRGSCGDGDNVQAPFEDKA